MLLHRSHLATAVCEVPDGRRKGSVAAHGTQADTAVSFSPAPSVWPVRWQRALQRRKRSLMESDWRIYWLLFVDCCLDIVPEPLYTFCNTMCVYVPVRRCMPCLSANQQLIVPVDSCVCVYHWVSLDFHPYHLGFPGQASPPSQLHSSQPQEMRSGKIYLNIHWHSLWVAMAFGWTSLSLYFHQTGISNSVCYILLITAWTTSLQTQIQIEIKTSVCKNFSQHSDTYRCHICILVSVKYNCQLSYVLDQQERVSSFNISFHLIHYHCLKTQLIESIESIESIGTLFLYNNYSWVVTTK